jgi:hypothetical protein
MSKKPQKSDEIMSNKPLPWPYTAKEARDRSAEEAVVIMSALAAIMAVTNDPMILRLLFKAERSATTIVRFMEREGAPTRPE